MKRRDYALGFLAIAIGLFIWPVLGWQFGVGIGFLSLSIVQGLFALREEQDNNVYLKQIQDVMMQTVKQTTERVTEQIVRICIENALRSQPPINPGEKGH